MYQGRLNNQGADLRVRIMEVEMTRILVSLSLDKVSSL